RPATHRHQLHARRLDLQQSAADPRGAGDSADSRGGVLSTLCGDGGDSLGLSSAPGAMPVYLNPICMATSADRGIIDCLSLLIAANTASTLSGLSGTSLLTSRMARNRCRASMPAGAIRLSMASPNPDGTLKVVLFGARWSANSRRWNRSPSLPRT